MYLIYVDESGNRDPHIIKKRDGASLENDRFYVLVGISLFEHRWHGFEKTINRKKRDFISRIYRENRVQLELADCEVKSNFIRIPQKREEHKFLGRLSESELNELVRLYFHQLEHHKINVFAIVMDKKYLHDYFDRAKIHRKAWELLLERIENFMRLEHPRHQVVLVTDDTGRHENRALAMKHVYLQEEGTSSGLWLTHIAEMPLFTRSELSNGIQLADLIAYNIYRAFRSEDISYPPFLDGVLPYIWSNDKTPPENLEGLKIFPPMSDLYKLTVFAGEKRALIDVQSRSRLRKT